MDSGFLSFFAATVAHFYSPSLSTKCLPIWLLAIRTYLLPAEECPDKTIAFGLMISSIGDACLHLESEHRQGEMKDNLFLVGLLSFLLAHILYTKAFLHHTSFHTKILCLPLFVYYMAMMSIILPEAPSDMHYPIMIYGLAIAFMGYSCLNFYFNVVDPTWKPQALMGMIGAVFFIISDSILAIAKFSKWGEVFGGHQQNLVMVTYYIGQFLIARSSILGSSSSGKKSKEK